MSRIGAPLGVVGIVLMLVGFVGPWWTIGVSASFGGQTITSNSDFRLFGGTVTTIAPGLSRTNTTDYADDPNTRSAFLTGAAFIGLAIAFGVVFAVLAIMAYKKASSRRTAAVCGILAFVLGLVGALYVMAVLPGAVNADSAVDTFTGFWGTDSTTFFGISANVTWTAGWAWYIVLVGSITFLIGGILAMRAPKAAPAMMPPPAEMPPIP